MKDYEQLYYDSQFEIRQLKIKISYLEDLLMGTKTNRKSILLQKYIIAEINNYKGKV